VIKNRSIRLRKTWNHTIGGKTIFSEKAGLEKSKSRAVFQELSKAEGRGKNEFFAKEKFFEGGDLQPRGGAGGEKEGLLNRGRKRPRIKKRGSQRRIAFCGGGEEIGTGKNLIFIAGGTTSSSRELTENWEENV